MITYNAQDDPKHNISLLIWLAPLAKQIGWLRGDVRDLANTIDDINNEQVNNNSPSLMAREYQFVVFIIFSSSLCWIVQLLMERDHEHDNKQMLMINVDYTRYSFIISLSMATN